MLARRPLAIPLPAGRFARPFLLHVFEDNGEQIELLLPIFGVPVDPDCGLIDGTGFQATATDPAASLLRHQSRLYQHLDVPGDRLQADRKRRRKLGDEQLMSIKATKNGAPHRIGKGREDQIEDFCVGLLRREAGSVKLGLMSHFINQLIDKQPYD